MGDPTKGPRAMALFLGVGLALALGLAWAGQPVVAAVIGALAVAGAVRAALGEGPAGAPPDLAPPAEAAYAPVIAGARFGGVFVEVGPSAMVLCLFPVADPDGGDELASVKAPPGGLAGVIVFNDAPGAHLFGSRAIEALGVAREHVWATAPERKLDRASGVDTGARQAKRLPERLELAGTELARRGEHARIQWGARYGYATALVGAAIPDDALAARPHPSFVIGGLRLDDPKAVGLDLLMALRHVMLIEGSATGVAIAQARFFSTMGVAATVLGARDPDAVVREHLDAAREGGEAFEAKLAEAPVPVWIDVFTELAVLGEHALADARLERLLELRPDGRLCFELGISRLLGGRAEEAADAFRRATELGSAIAWNSLASTLRGLGRLDEARAAIREGQARMPDDPITWKTAVAIHALAGDEAAARRAIEEGPFDDAQRDELRARLEEPPERYVDRFEGYAAIARRRGTERIDAGDLAGAEAILRRAIALDPLDLEAHVELAFVLGRREDDAALRALSARAIDEVPGGELLRFNLANLALRTGDPETARVELEALLAKVPTHRDARVNLVGALCMLDRKAEARGHLDALAAAGLDPELLARLRAQCA